MVVLLGSDFNGLIKTTSLAVTIYNYAIRTFELFESFVFSVTSWNSEFLIFIIYCITCFFVLNYVSLRDHVLVQIQFEIWNINQCSGFFGIHNFDHILLHR